MLPYPIIRLSHSCVPVSYLIVVCAGDRRRSDTGSVFSGSGLMDGRAPARYVCLHGRSVGRAKAYSSRGSRDELEVLGGRPGFGSEEAAVKLASVAVTATSSNGGRPKRNWGERHRSWPRRGLMYHDVPRLDGPVGGGMACLGLACCAVAGLQGNPCGWLGWR